MTNQSILALVVSSSGVLQNGLLALMTSIPQISTVLVAEDANSTIRMAENHQPALIVLDMTLPDMLDVIEQIKQEYPDIHLIVLAEDIEQGKDVEEIGADSVLIKGFSAQKLLSIIEIIVDCRVDASTVQTITKG